MDAGRFGRALGTGAREAAKAAVKAAEAAKAPSPAPRNPVQAASSVRNPPVIDRAHNARRQTAQTTRGIRRGGKKFGEAIWGPFAKLSGVLWLEVTGVLFGMFAAVAALEVWKGRASFHAGDPQIRHEIFAVLMLAVFGYFTASSFFRASRRQRR